MNNNNFHYTKQDIINSLKKVGIIQGDNVFIHSNIGFFGLLKDAKNKADYYHAFKQSLQEILGSTGTFVVTTQSYSFCWGQEFDKNNTPSVHCGFFSESVRQDPESIRSDDANFSVAAIGKNAKYFTQNASSYSFGLDSFWERFLKEDGKFCSFNIDYLTFIHYLEWKFKVPYRFEKPFSGIAIENGKKVKKVFYHFCTELNQPDHTPDLNLFIKKAFEKNIVETAPLGRGQLICRNAQDIHDLIKEALSYNPNFLITGKKKTNDLTKTT